MVYTAGRASLAALEVLVHLEAHDVLKSYSLTRIDFADELVEVLDRKRLPVNWTDHADPVAAGRLKALGDAWVRDGSSVILEVPSAIVPIDSCYLVNPTHSDFGAFVMSAPEPFPFDERLRRARS